jgi:phytoene dehydrogenase-like protein
LAQGSRTASTAAGATPRRYDAVVVGGGPNGLAAAITLATAGRSVLLREATGDIGGGTRTMELTLPGYHHDVCSAVHPTGAASPFFLTLPLHEYGLEWVHAPTLLAHPFDDGRVALLDRSVAETAATLGIDARRYRRIIEPLLADWDTLVHDLLAPIRVPRHPFQMARFGLHALRSVKGFARSNFRDDPAAALLAGCAAHCMLPLHWTATASFGLVLLLSGHVAGWPVARGGSRAITDAMAAHLRRLGGEIELNAPVENIDELPAAHATLLNLTPRQVLQVAGHRLPAGYRRALGRWVYGPGTFKVDWALSEPVPWTQPECGRAMVVHLGGTVEEIIAAEHAPWQGRAPERPFTLFSQPTPFDPVRAPEGRHTAWAYCHVPHGSTEDMTTRIEAQVERFAPGFRETILARHVIDPAHLHAHNANMIGGDINGGAQYFRQLLFRPVPRWNPYTTPVKGLYLCSSSTPPGGAVHGMCGWHAATAALDRW